MEAKFKFLDDAPNRFEAYGSSFEEALQNAALAVFEKIADTQKVKGDKRVLVTANSTNFSDLVAAVLSALIAQGNSKSVFFKLLTLDKLKEKNGVYYLRGIAWGSVGAPELARNKVKAANHKDISADQQDEKWIIRATLDV